MQDILRDLKETKHSLVLHCNQTLLGDTSYRSNIKHVYNIQIQKYIICKQEHYTELCTNEVKMTCNNY